MILLPVVFVQQFAAATGAVCLNVLLCPVNISPLATEAYSVRQGLTDVSVCQYQCQLICSPICADVKTVF